MRRQKQRRMHLHGDEDDYNTTVNSVNHPLLDDDYFSTETSLQLQNLPRYNAHVQHRFENTIEAKVSEGDTLQSMALRFHCTVADIKRLNKMDKDNEIYARKVLKIPLTVHSMLLGETLPTVHKSGNNSPKHSQNQMNSEEAIDAHIMRNPLEDAKAMLGEKLLVASVNASTSNKNANINHAILNSKSTRSTHIYKDDDLTNDTENYNAATTALLDDEFLPRIRPIKGPSLRAFDWSGSDCDMSWVCLFIVILAACFVIPLVYVIYLAEHVHHHNASSPH